MYSILVNSCDNFEDCWQPFFRLFSIYWPDFKGKIYLNTEYKDFSYSGLEIVCTKVCEANNITRSNRATWSQCLKWALEMIDSDIVLYMQEDYFFKDTVKSNLIEKYVTLMLEKEDIKCIHLTDQSVLSANKSEYINLDRVAIKQRYRVSCQAALWRKSELLELIRVKENAWEFEEFGSIRSASHKKNYLVVNKSFVQINHFEIIPYIFTGIIQGRWSDEVIPLFHKNGIYVDYSKRGFVSDAPSKPFVKRLKTGFNKIPKKINSFLFNLFGFDDENFILVIKNLFIRVIKLAFRLATNKKFLNPNCDCDRQSANDKIYDLLKRDQPCMISRFGTTEINCVNNYLCVKSSKSDLIKIWNYISDKTHTPWWNEEHFKIMSLYSGIFPIGVETAEKFSERYLNDIPEIDLLGCHQYYEMFMPLKPEIIKVQLEMLYPFFIDRPWSRILKGKKVLVIHPFDETIKFQYEKRNLLFNNQDVLPEFELITYKAIQSVAGNSVPFKSWFAALDFMEKEIAEIDFEIAIIGCGAYGLPLAALIKRMGKKAIHLAGGTQLLFGIKGKRWVEQYDEEWIYRPGINININYRPLFNNNWIFPLQCDTPQNSNKVENGCYW